MSNAEPQEGVNGSTISPYSEAEVPTRFGTFRLLVFREPGTNNEHCAMVRGDVRDADNLLVRVHSECFTGEVVYSLKCDCRQQLDQALQAIDEADRGALVYLRQEGRGIGLGNKIRAYALQQQGIDTVDANIELGFEPDLRRYHMASQILKALGVRSVELLTNNPDKVAALRADGVEVSARVAMEILPNRHNRDYLDTKRERMGHLIP